MNYKYLLDSNVLATSAVIEIIDTDFFQENCIIISEIAFELSDTSIADRLAKYTVSPSASTLQQLVGIADELVKLGILKTDHGNGEALLLAEALSIKDGGQSQLLMDFMRDRPVIVTDERAVDAYAKSINIEAISGREFLDIFNAVAKEL